MSDDDLIRRGDARRIVLAYASGYSAEKADTAIAALPAVAAVRAAIAAVLNKPQGPEEK